MWKVEKGENIIFNDGPDFQIFQGQSLGLLPFLI